jgi:hypothetical protein
MRAETFRRVCMSFDAWIVAFGLSRLLGDLGLVRGGGAWLVLVGTIVLDAWLLVRFFAAHGSADSSEPPYANPHAIRSD